MKRLVVLVIIAFAFVLGSAVSLNALTVKQSPKRAEENRSGRKIQPGRNNKEKADERKDSRDTKDSQKDSKEKSDNRQKARDAAESRKDSREEDNSENSNTSREEQLMGIEKDIADEKTKFSDRKAKLEQKKQDAEQKGDTATVARTDGILKREQEAHERKIQNMEEKRQKVLDIIKRKSDDDANKPAK